MKNQGKETKQKLKRIRFRIFHEVEEKLKWEHVCYVPMDIYTEFCEKLHVNKDEEFADYVAEWFFYEFSIPLSMTTLRDLIIFQDCVRERYKTLYPDMYYNLSATDEEWVRVWMVRQMRGELKNV